ncbi:WD repeat-containing protein on Y chromosome-like [Littorina saxatilis]|uniref:WD repeat-containing protein on Y chromosome n=1 Tax=Littorina saxatilis TaxID=31220 RepID=A0AAN9GL39_9CAEN
MHNDTSHSERRQKSSEPEQRYSVVKHVRSRNTGAFDFTLLNALHDEFLERWHGEDLGLTRREFMAAMKRTAGFCLKDSELNRIYSQVDSKDEGLMTWGQYITSLSNTASLRASMVQSDIKPLFQDKMHFTQIKQRDEIIAIRFIPRLPLYATKINHNSGRYLMLGREGSLTMWSINLTLLNSYFIGSNKGVLKAMLFIDLVVLHPSTMIAVTSTDRTITIYELGSRGLKEKYTIVSIYNCITCMDYWPDLHSRTFMLLLWGDVAGDIHALELNVKRLGGIFDKDDNREIINRVVYADLLKHKFPSVHLHKVPGVHDDWVTEIRYIAETRAFLSSSSSHTNKSLCYTDWRGKVETRFYQSYTSVLCFDFNYVIHLVVTGSLDCQVRVWNIFMPNRPINTLKGHLAPVDHVVLNLKTQHVISLDKSHAIKIFDYKEGSVIQAFSGPSLSIMGPNTIEGFFFNRERCQIIVGTLTVGMTIKRVNPPDMAEVSAHDFPIVAVCYSSTFDEVITACANAVISVWDLHTGRHVLEFQHYSSRTNFKDVPWASATKRLEVTAMTLDGSERCVVTGANDGTVNLWNFSSGVLLANYELPDNNLVSGLAVDRNVIFATGWCRQIFLLDLDQKSSKQNLKFFKNYHKEDVNCMTLLKGGLIATGSYDGDIIVLTRDTGHGRCRLNPGVAMFPIPLMTTQDEVDAVTLGPTESELLKLESPETSEIFIENEDHSFIKGIRIGEDKVLLANPLTGQILRIITKPRELKRSASDLIFDVFKGHEVSMQESANHFRAYESSVDILLNLKTRKHLDLNTANIITAGSEGWIRAWSLNPKGGLKGQFLATEQLGESVKAMTTDTQNEFLLTGDTMGYVKVWDLFPFCHPAAKLVSEEVKADRRDRFIKMFIFLRSPFLRDAASEGFERCVRYHKRRPPPESNPESSLKTPKLLNVFHAHMQAITALTYVDDGMLIITGSKDCSVRVWTITGSFVGHCGAPWVKLPSSEKSPLRPLPKDIRRNASARTFRVIKGGRVPAWDRAVRLIRNYLEQQKKMVEKKEGQTAEDGEEDDKAWLAQPVMVDRDESALPEHLRLSSVVKFTWRDPKKSQYLGMAFKPCLHHRHLSYTPKINMREDFGQIAAYRQVQISDMSKMTAIPTPQIIIDMEKRHKEEEEEAQMYRNLAKQSKCSKQCPGRNRRSVFKKSIGSCPIGAGQTAQNSVSGSNIAGHAGKLSVDCLSSPSRSQRTSIRLSVESIRNHNATQNNRAGFDENPLKNSTDNNKAGFARATCTENPLKNSTHNNKAGFAGATCAENPLKNSTHNNKAGFAGATCTENPLKNSTHNIRAGFAEAACVNNPSTKSTRNNVDDFDGGPHEASRAKKKLLRIKNDNTARAGFPKPTSTLMSDDKPDLKRSYPQTQHDKATDPQNPKRVSTVNNNNDDDDVNDGDLLRAVERENLFWVKTSAEATGNRKNSFSEKLSRQQSSRTDCVLPQISETNAPLLEGGALPLSSSTKGEFSRKRTRHNGGGDKVKIGFEVTLDTDDVIATQRDLTSDPSDVSTATSKDDDESTSKKEDDDEEETPTDSRTSETTSAEKSSSASSGKSEELISRFPPIGSSCAVNQVGAFLTESSASSLPESLPSISKLTVICPERKKKEQLFRGTGLMMGSFALPALSKRHD